MLESQSHRGFVLMSALIEPIVSGEMVAADLS